MQAVSVVLCLAVLLATAWAAPGTQVDSGSNSGVKEEVKSPASLEEARVHLVPSSLPATSPITTTTSATTTTPTTRKLAPTPTPTIPMTSAPTTTPATTSQPTNPKVPFLNGTTTAPSYFHNVATIGNQTEDAIDDFVSRNISTTEINPSDIPTCDDQEDFIGQLTSCWEYCDKVNGIFDGCKNGQCVCAKNSIVSDTS